MADSDIPVTASGDTGGEPVTASEEPQDERGTPGSRDKGGPPGAGPTDRPTDTSSAEDHTSVHPQESTEGGPTLAAGGG